MLQQDSYIEDQKLVLSEKVLTRSASRPSSLIEQEKQRSLEKQRQDLANLQKQQAQHLEEKRRREREWEAREQELRDREAKLAEREEAVRRRQQDLERDREELQQKKGTYQCDLERLRAAQKQLEREQEQLKRDAERLSQRQMDQDLCQVPRACARPVDREEGASYHEDQARNLMEETRGEIPAIQQLCFTLNKGRTWVSLKEIEEDGRHLRL